MAATSGTHDEQALRQATNWLIALREEPEDLALQVRFNAWLTVSEANRMAWEATEHAYDLIGEAAASRTRSVAVSVRPRSLVQRGAFWLAGAVVTAGLSVVFGPMALLHWRADYLTGTGEERSLNLADGTRIELGPRSAIQVAYDSAERCVRLLSGQAFFDIKHDASKPFHVEVHGLQVTDIGTRFDVQLARDATSIEVAQGEVRVGAANGSSWTLQSGQWMRLTPAGQVTRGSVRPDQVATWQRGQLIANDRPVSEVVDELRPYFNGLILVNGGELDQRRVTGVYDLHHPIETLRALAIAHPDLAIRQISPWLLVVSGR